MKKLLLLFAAIVMASTGLWAETVSYLYPVYNTDGVPTSGIKEWKNGSANATVVDNASEPVTWGTTGTTTWYVVTGADVKLSKGAICQGDVRLILADGAKLTTEGYEKLKVNYEDYYQSTYEYYPGIKVSCVGNNSFTIYGQTAQTGQLFAIGESYAAGIGGLGIAGYDYNSSYKNDVDCSNITINGGTVTANGGSSAAGIGGGNNGSGSNITINAGTVTANGGSGAAGIGGGRNGSGSNITINGGTVTANGGGEAAGIGGGRNGSGSNITINGGTVTANGGYGASAIGSGATSDVPFVSEDIYVAAQYNVRAGDSENPTNVIATNHTIETDIASELAGYRFVIVEPKFAVVYGDHITVSPSFESGTRIAPGTQLTFTAADRSEDSYLFLGFYKDGNFNTPITTGVSGRTYTVTMTDADMSVYARYKEITVVYGDHITVSPSFESGTRIASGTQITFTAADRSADGYAFIGFYKESTFDTPITTGVSDMTYTVTVTDAISVYARYEYPQYVSYIDEQGVSHDTDAYVVAASSAHVNWGVAGKTTWYVVQGTDVQLSQGAICNGDVRLILADGAKLTATGREYVQAGIQVSGEGNSLTIYGQANQSGQLEANGAFFVSGIGGSRDEGDGSNITINGGKVTANGGASAAGIGGGYYRAGSNITINGGTVTANGGGQGAGIGGGHGGSGYNIAINGGTVTATGGLAGAGIGGGYTGIASNITINGGTVTAIGGKYDSSIGIGSGSDATNASSNIFVATILTLKAGDNENSTTEIENNGGDLAESLAGKLFVTVSDDVCNITANQAPDDTKHYYSTFYYGKKGYSVPEGVTAYTGVTNGSVLTLTPVANGIIPAGEAVILRLTTTDNTAMTQQIQLTATTTTATKSDDNMLQGSDAAMTLPQNSYALSLGQKGVGFYKFDDVELPAHKAYLTYASGSAISLRFSFGDATDIDDVETEAPAKAYNLQGQQVDESYKGIVIKNGKKMLNN